MCRIVMLLAFEGRECLTPAVAPPAGHWDLLAAGRLDTGSKEAGGCGDFEVPQVVHRLLLSS